MAQKTTQKWTKMAMAMLAMTILIHFWVVYLATEPPTLTLRANLRHYIAILQPSYLAHARLVGCLVWLFHGAFYVS